MQEDIFYLRLRTFKAPCLSIMDLDKLHVNIKYPVNENSAIDKIHSLFSLLKMPISWILSIEPPPWVIAKNCLPFEIHVKLITDNIKLFVFKTIKNHLKETNQKLTYIKLYNH